MSRLKITKGKNFTVIPSNFEDPKDSWYDIIVNPLNGWGKWVADSKSASIIDGTIEEAKANAELIADAFNTANETDKLPSELKQERDELMNLAKEISLYSNSKSLNKKAEQLINKIESK